MFDDEIKSEDTSEAAEIELPPKDEKEETPL